MKPSDNNCCFSGEEWLNIRSVKLRKYYAVHMGDSRNKNYGTKTAEQKQRNKNCWGTLRHWVVGLQVQVEKGLQNKTAEQKQQNKNWWG